MTLDHGAQVPGADEKGDINGDPNVCPIEVVNVGPPWTIEDICGIINIPLIRETPRLK